MGEYVKYRGNDIEIGMGESLYYVTYQKYKKELASGNLSESIGGGPPEGYAKPDSGFRFRFPFPDEDNLPLGDIGEFAHNRGLPILVDLNADNEKHPQILVALNIVQQKLVHRQSDGRDILALVVKEPATGDLVRLEDESLISKLCKQIELNH